MDFVRLAGCDLACAYCDTADARDFAAGRNMTVAEVLAALPQPPLEWLEITGGEPAHQAVEVNQLVAALIDGGRRVMIETNGAHPIDLFDSRAIRIVDVKTPGSGMAHRNCWRNLELLTPQDEVKFVLTGRADYDWAKEVFAQHRLAQKSAVLFSPVAPGLEPRTLAEWIVADALPARLNLQIHKILKLP
jgi:7-carboxy-7-deazaguanine synthase